MKKLFLILCLIAIVYVLGTFTVDQFIIFANKAALVLSGGNNAEARTIVLDEYNATLSDTSKKINADTPITFETAYINTDTEKDFIATIHSTDTCGSGGCITSILIKNETGKYESIHFSFALKKITVESSITSGMHDLRVNNDKKGLMRWNGSEYSLNGF